MATSNDFAEWQDFLDAQGQDYREMIFELARRYDTDFLDFVCAHDGEWGILDVVPTGAQREIIGELYQLSENLAEIADSDTRRIATARELGGYVSELDTTRALEWHRRCGGLIPEFEDDGSVEAALRVLAGDFVGFSLLRGRTHISAVLERHPSYGVLFDRFGDDEPLGKMFEDAVSRSSDPEASIFEVYPRSAALLPLWSDGTCQTLQFHYLPGELIVNARVAEYVPNNIVGMVQEAAIADFERARKLSSGETVTVSTYVGLAGVRLGDEVDHIGLEGIRLRRSTPLDPGCLNATTQVCTIAEVDTDIRYLHNNIQKDRHNDEGFPVFESRANEHNEVNQEHYRAQVDIIDRLRFAMLLSSGVEEALATVEVFKTVANPMVGAWASLPSGLAHNAAVPALSEEAAVALNKWLPMVAAMPDHLLLSMRRLMRAAAERSDPADRLIDAVVAWEGLFGANPEIKFQVTGSMSVLLETEDMIKRAALKTELGKIYDMRSTFVHGAGDVGDKKLSIEDVTDRAGRSVSLAIAAFQEVLRNPELAAIATSRLRSQKILLGF